MTAAFDDYLPSIKRAYPEHRLEIARAADRLRCRARGSRQRLVLAVDHENHGMRSSEPPRIIMSYQALTIAMRVSLVRPPVPRYNSLKIGAK